MCRSGNFTRGKYAFSLFVRSAFRALWADVPIDTVVAHVAVFICKRDTLKILRCFWTNKHTFRDMYARAIHAIFLQNPLPVLFGHVVFVTMPARTLARAITARDKINAGYRRV
ncbi:uncharacterized protein SCHCODRAFT_02266393 [Schizophyllum commune H4-8]|uniref:uncharacterized protein n=1 Tax=Schizophyllum commune (strain H4-8 / FGSC 9210) TaxID=578458 RepID=UPI00215F10C4|nr:uncharacterized protein SCHCODRAFT_02266393 [Schizophyllum commune H4-8]KAI5894004.1 hypothetical protein SCHCODRAFT_02266393 [Schizophyllum commune H4-8]